MASFSILALGKGRWYSSQSGRGKELAIAPIELSAVEQQQHVTRYILGGMNSFPHKARRVCWHLASAEHFQLSFSSPSIHFHCCSMCQGSMLLYGLIIAPVASLLSMKGSNRVITAPYQPIRGDNLPTYWHICLVTPQLVD